MLKINKTVTEYVILAPKSIFHVHISPFSCLTAWKRPSKSKLTAVKLLTYSIFKTTSRDLIQQSWIHYVTRVLLVEMTGWSPMIWPNFPFALSRKSCVPPQNNITPMFERAKTTVSIGFIIKIHHIVSIYMSGCWRIQSILKKLLFWKMAYVRNPLPIDPSAT